MRRVKALATLVVLGFGLCLAGMSPAADDKDKDREDNKRGGDQEFATKASAAGLAEVNLSNLAVRSATNPAVQQFAQRMVQDHTRANQQLIQIANQKNVRLATNMDKKHQDLMNQLTKSQGAQFDRRYMRQMVQDHEEAVKLFERESKDGNDAALKQFAATALPILRDHLKMARDVANRVGAGDKGGDRDKDKGGDQNRDK